ncbi:hypothetical protein K1719_035744 [Acacia pycnantha]|nr:hypothetical protein K1719_035744 [Acacia pycnantha]
MDPFPIASLSSLQSPSLSLLAIDGSSPSSLSRLNKFDGNPFSPLANRVRRCPPSALFSHSPHLHESVDVCSSPLLRGRWLAADRMGNIGR